MIPQVVASERGIAQTKIGIEIMNTATPGSILVEIQSSRLDASCGVIEDGESIFIVFVVL